VQRALRNIVTRLNFVGRSSDIREHLRSHRSHRCRRIRRDETYRVSHFRGKFSKNRLHRDAFSQMCKISERNRKTRETK